MAYGTVDLFFQAASGGVMHIPPEADALGIEIFFHLVNERAVRKAAGDEKRGNLDRLLDSYIIVFYPGLCPF